MGGTLGGELLIIPGFRFFHFPHHWSSFSQNMQLSVDDTITEKPSKTDIISEIDESIMDEEKVPSSAIERERNDIIKVKKVCKCSYELVVVVKINWMHSSVESQFPLTGSF